MKWSFVICLCAVGIAFQLSSCKDEQVGRTTVVEKVEGYKPNLPPVPNIPKPTVPETYPDGSYSVYGLRKGIRNNIEQQATVTAFISKIYQKPECPEGKTCYTLMPHLYLADDKSGAIEKRLLKLVGYARSFKEMEEEKEGTREDDLEELPEGVYLPPVVWDWREGHKYKITGNFTRQSGAGFMATDGLLEYASHECLDCPAEEEEEEEKKK